MNRFLRIHRLVLFLALLVQSSGTTSLALSPSTSISQYIHNSWQTDDGLPQNYVQAIAQTRDGYIWLGTQEGLVRFDGISFTVFDAQDSSLKDNNIQALLEDREGNLWVGTDGGGLYRLNDGKFTALTTRDGLSADIVESIYEDAKGDLWIGTLGGLDMLKGGKITTYTKREGLANDNVLAICEDRTGAIWAGTEGGLSQLNSGKFTTYTTDTGLSNDLVRSIAQDNQGNLWIATRGGLDRLSGGQFIHYSTKQGLASDSVLAICPDKDGNLWIGTSGGLNRLNSSGVAAYTAKDGLTNNSVGAIMQDREGNLWLGTYGGGLNCLKEGKFVSFTTQSGLSDDFAQSVYQDRQGNLWVGTHQGLNRFKDGKFAVYSKRQGLPDNVVLSICEDSFGSLWIGTSGGVSRFSQGRFTNFTTKQGLSDDNVLSILAGRAGTLWIGTAGGLDRLDKGRFTAYTTDQGLSNNSVWSLAEDPDGSLWIGTDGGGLNRLQDGRFAKYTIHDGLPNNTVLSLLEDADRGLWVGTSGGLALFKDGRFTSFTTANGLFDNVVFQILEDSQDQLWLSSDKGICKVRKRELAEFAAGKIGSFSCVSYGTADGMKSRECNGGFQPAGWKSSDGRLWFPTMKGVVMIDPAATEINTQPPPVNIESIVVDGTPITTLVDLRLEPGKEKFEFHYAGLSFVAPQKVRFKYKLEGFDRDWVDAGTRRDAAYTNIRPGPYRFRVIACNNDGIWNETGASVNFYLEPYFYQTNWFYLACGALVALAGFGLYRMRVNRMRAQFDAVLNERSRIAREIHDTLAQGFAGISLQLESVAETIATSTPAALDHLNKARSLVRTSLAEARRSVLDLRTGSIDTGNLGTALSAIARQLSGGAPIDVRVLGTPVRLSDAVEKNMLHIGREALTNAVKHSKARHIEAEVQFQKHRITLRVKDDGQGFDAKSSPAGDGFGLVSMAERARQIGSQLELVSIPGQGTTITVSAPR